MRRTRRDPSTGGPPRFIIAHADEFKSLHWHVLVIIGIGEWLIPKLDKNAFLNPSPPFSLTAFINMALPQFGVCNATSLDII